MIRHQLKYNDLIQITTKLMYIYVENIENRMTLLSNCVKLDVKFFSDARIVVLIRSMYL